MEEDFKSAKELIESLSSDYYEKTIEELEQQIINLKSGKPQYERVYDNIASPTLTEKEKNSRIKTLNKKIEELKKKRTQLSLILSKLNDYSFKIENLAKKLFLMELLLHLLVYEQDFFIEKSSAFLEYENKYSKALKKPTTNLRKVVRQLNDEIYKLFKKNPNLVVYKDKSIKTLFNDSKYNMEDLLFSENYEIKHGFNDKSHDFLMASRNKESNPKYFEGKSILSSLRIDTNKLSKLLETMSKEPDKYSISYLADDSFKKLEEIRNFKTKDYTLRRGSLALVELEKKYEKIIDLARQIWYVEEIISIFNDTAINKSEVFKEIREVIKEQEEKLKKAIKEADKIYNDLNLKEILEKEKELQEIYQRILWLNGLIRDEKGNTKKENYEIEIHKLKIKMNDILVLYPELNSSEYDIVLREQKEHYKINQENEVNNKDIVKREHNDINNNNNETNERNINIPKEENIKTPTSKTEKFKEIELDYNLRSQRTAFYSKYMIEKVKESALGKISFSEYLKIEAPYLKDLIEIEEKREEMAKTLYKDYIKYLASLEDKKGAMSFNEFCQRKYSIDNVEVPIEFEEEYKGMKI